MGPYLFSITTIKNPSVTNQKKTEVPNQSLFGSFSTRKKGLFVSSMNHIEFAYTYMYVCMYINQLRYSGGALVGLGWGVDAWS